MNSKSDKTMDYEFERQCLIQANEDSKEIIEILRNEVDRLKKELYRVTMENAALLNKFGPWTNIVSSPVSIAAKRVEEKK